MMDDIIENMDIDVIEVPGQRVYKYRNGHRHLRNQEKRMPLGGEYGGDSEERRSAFDIYQRLGSVLSIWRNGLPAKSTSNIDNLVKQSLEESSYLHKQARGLEH